MQLFLKLLSRMANSVDPDKTSGAVWSGCVLFAYALLSETLVYKILDIYHTTLSVLMLLEKSVHTILHQLY